MAAGARPDASARTGAAPRDNPAGLAQARA